ncbi:MAG TPA: hypothetical protein VEW03_02060, partial [Longimicrobiaceae bacterium]|nr:hypothetical protein [Longimicrobiaceae bacterium]
MPHPSPFLRTAVVALTMVVSAKAARAQVSVTPDGQAMPRPANQHLAESYTVTNTGSAATTYTLQAVCSGGTVSCSPTLASVTLGPAASTLVGVNYS